MTLRIVSRAIVFDKNKILLVQNEGQSFWYPPGGEWECKKENIKEAACREVLEEVGLKINIEKFLYLQEFHPKENIAFLEVFWLAELSSGEKSLNPDHIDTEGQVEKAKWYSKKEMENIKVFPENLKSSFWKMDWKDREDLFIFQQ